MKFFLCILFLTSPAFAKNFKANKTSPKKCAFKIYTGIRSEIYIDSNDLDKGTYFRYELFPLESLGAYSDFPFLALPLKEDGKPRFEDVSLVIASDKIQKDKKLAPLKNPKIIKDAHLPNSKKGHFQTFQVPDGSLFELFRLDIEKEAQMRLIVHSKGKVVCEIQVPLTFEEDH